MGELSNRLINHIKNNPQKVIISTGRSLNLNGNFLTYYKKRVYGNIGLDYRIGRNESNDGLKIKPPSSGVVESFFDKHVRGFETIESFLTKQFDRIEKNGEQSLRDILTFLENDGRLTINLMDDGGETLFRSNADGSFTINLGISKKSGVKLKSQNELQVPHYGISHRVSVPTSNGISPIEAVLIQERDDPFHIAIGHEMNHLKHREDGSNIRGIRRDFRENKESEEKKDSSRVNNKGVWPNPEEHRNVFGLADPGSELNARMEAGLHLRYPYNTDAPFPEPVKTVLRNAVKSERHIEGTTLPPLSVEGWVRRLVDLRDRLDALPSTSLPSFTATTTPSRGSAASSSSSGSSSSSIMTSSSSSLSSSKEHLTASNASADTSEDMFQPISGSTKIKLLPYLLNGDYSSIPNEYKEQMLQAQAQKRESKGKPTPWNDSGARTETTEGRFSMMMDTIRGEQDTKIQKKQDLAKAYGVDSKYADIPGILAKEIANGNLRVSDPSYYHPWPTFVPKGKETLEESIFKTLRNILEEKELPPRAATPVFDTSTNASPLRERQGSSSASPLSSLHYGKQQTTTTASFPSPSSSPHMELMEEDDSGDTARTSSPMSESSSRSLFGSSIPSSPPRPQSTPLTKPELQQSKFSGFSYLQSSPTPADNTPIRTQLMSPATQLPSASRSLSQASSVSPSASPFSPNQLPTSSSSSSAQPLAVQPHFPLQTVPLLRPRPMMPSLAYLSQPSVASSAFAPPIQRVLSAPPAFFRRG